MASTTYLDYLLELAMLIDLAFRCTRWSMYQTMEYDAKHRNPRMVETSCYYTHLFDHLDAAYTHLQFDDLDATQMCRKS